MEKIGIKNAKRNIETNRNVNKLVPQLIKQSNTLKTELNNRMKLNLVFSEFELKATNKLNFFIKESKKRYLGSKSGCNLNSLIANSRKKCVKEAKKVINDNFYCDTDIFKEREKMKNKTSEKMYKDYKETISKIKNLSINDNNSVNYFEKENNFDEGRFNTKINLRKTNCNIMPTEKLLKDKDNMERYLNKEKVLFGRTMDNYKNELHLLNTLSKIRKYSHINNNKNMLVVLPKLNLLSYKKYTPTIVKEEEGIFNKINYKKLFRYSRLGKMFGIKKNNGGGGKKNKMTAFITQAGSPGLYTNYEVMKNMRDTNEMVFNSAKKEINIENRINKKRKIIERMLGIDNIPKLDSYETIVKDMRHKRKKERKIQLTDDEEEAKEADDILGLLNKKIVKGFQALNDIEKKYHNLTQPSFNRK